MSFHNFSAREKPEKIYLHLSKRITVYGPHFPNKEKKKLDKLCIWLRENDLKNTNLVINLPDSHFPFPISKDSDIRNWERSEYCLNTSDLNIIIFTVDGKNSGVTSELDYLIEKNINFLMFIETKIIIKRNKRKKKIRAGSSIIRGRLKKISIAYHEFPSGNEDDFYNTVYQNICDFFQ